MISARRAGTRPLRGPVTVPGDKSISHRAVLFAALADGRSRLTGVNAGQDVRATIGAVVALGARVGSGEDLSNLEVEGHGFGGLREPEDVLDAGNSGTTLRTLLGVCSGIEGTSVLTGDASLRHRPMLRVVHPLRQMGAVIEGRRYGEHPPLAVRGGALVGVDVALPVASAQVKTALLLAGLRAAGRTAVTEPGVSRDHTERMLEAAGVELERAGSTVAVAGGQEMAAVDRRVPGDPSAAAFLIVAAVLIPGSELRVERMALNPTRNAFVDVLRAMGADIDVRPDGEDGGEPFGTITARASDLHGVDIGAGSIPLLVDEIPILAIAAARANGITTITGAEELRIKESDRIAALTANLRILGGDVEERADGFVISGPTSLRGGQVDSFGDHRIAMAFAVAGLTATGKVRVRNWSCVDTSFPGFLEVLGRAQGRK